MVNAPQILPEKFLLEIIDGPDKGAQFQVFAGDIKIGRGETNDIVLNDPRCSREHAVLKISQQTVYIEDLGSQHGIIVDGQKGARAFISNGSKVTVGGTTFLFKRVASKPSPLLNEMTMSNNTSKVPDFFQSIAQDPKKMRFYIILGGAVIAALLLFSGVNSVKKQVSKPLSTDDEIENSRKRREALMKQQLESGKASRQYLDAQAAYTKGLRDYREGLYKSAVTSFNAALAIYPEHPTARRYLRLAQLKLDEQIQLILQEGNRFMDQGRYQNAKASFYEVMSLVNDPENKIYQEAKEKYNECVVILRESF